MALARAAWVFLLMEILAMQSAGAAQEAAAQGVTGSSGRESAPESAVNIEASVGPGTASPWLRWLPSLSDFGLESWSEVPRLGTWGGAIDLSVDGDRQTTLAPGNAEFKSTGRLTTQGITLRNQGFSLIDPRLVTGNVFLRFGLQQSQRSAGGTESGHSGQLTGYHLDTTFLSDKPYATTVFADRAQNVGMQIYGARTETETEGRGVVFQWRENSVLRDREVLPYFSATVQARQYETRQETRLTDRVFRMEERRRLLGIDGHNGSETSDLFFRLEQTNLENLVYPAGSYDSRLANVSHSMDFGPGLNRRLDTRVDYSTRRGAATMSLLNLSERLSIDHYRNLSTGYHYDFMQQDMDNGTTSVHSAGAQVHHRLYSNLSSNLGLSATQQHLPNGRIESQAARAWLSYTHGIPRNGLLSASLSGSEQVTQNRLESSLIVVSNAPYQAPPAFGAGAGVLLKESFIVPESIIVFDVRSGARLPAAPGIDYIVLVEGNRIRILPQPESLVVLPGDPLEISYVYNIDPSVKFRTSARSLNISADWNWIGVSFSHDESLQKPLSESETFLLTSRRADSARLELRGNWDPVQARGDATFSRYNYTQLVYDEWRLSQHVSYMPRDNLMISASASESTADYEFPQRRRSETRAVRLDLNWIGWGGWLTTAYVSRRLLHDTQIPSDAVTEASIRLQRRWSKLTLSGTFSMAERTRGGVQTNAASFHLSAIREF